MNLLLLSNCQTLHLISCRVADRSIDLISGKAIAVSESNTNYRQFVIPLGASMQVVINEVSKFFRGLLTQTPITHSSFIQLPPHQESGA
jgi:hypothetical protein